MGRKNRRALAQRERRQAQQVPHRPLGPSNELEELDDGEWIPPTPPLSQFTTTPKRTFTQTLMSKQAGTFKKGAERRKKQRTSRPPTYNGSSTRTAKRKRGKKKLLRIGANNNRTITSMVCVILLLCFLTESSVNGLLVYFGLFTSLIALFT